MSPRRVYPGHDVQHEGGNAGQEYLMRWNEWESWRDWFPETLKTSIILFAAFMGLLGTIQTIRGIGLLIWVGACLLISKAFNAW